MAVPPDADRLARAKESFKRLMIWTCLAGVLMTAAAIAYLAADEGPLTAHMIVATVAGVFISVFLGAGLMAVGFLSSNSGHDDRAADHRNRSEPPHP